MIGGLRLTLQGIKVGFGLPEEASWKAGKHVCVELRDAGERFR